MTMWSLRYDQPLPAAPERGFREEEELSQIWEKKPDRAERLVQTLWLSCVCSKSYKEISATLQVPEPLARQYKSDIRKNIEGIGPKHHQRCGLLG